MWKTEDGYAFAVVRPHWKVKVRRQDMAKVGQFEFINDNGDLLVLVRDKTRGAEVIAECKIKGDDLGEFFDEVFPPDEKAIAEANERLEVLLDQAEEVLGLEDEDDVDEPDDDEDDEEE